MLRFVVAQQFAASLRRCALVGVGVSQYGAVTTTAMPVEVATPRRHGSSSHVDQKHRDKQRLEMQRARAREKRQWEERRAKKAGVNLSHMLADLEILITSRDGQQQAVAVAPVGGAGSTAGAAAAEAQVQKASPTDPRAVAGVAAPSPAATASGGGASGDSLAEKEDRKARLRMELLKAAKSAAVAVAVKRRGHAPPATPRESAIAASQMFPELTEIHAARGAIVTSVSGKRNIAGSGAPSAGSGAATPVAAAGAVSTPPSQQAMATASEVAHSAASAGPLAGRRKIVERVLFDHLLQSAVVLRAPADNSSDSINSSGTANADNALFAKEAVPVADPQSLPWDASATPEDYRHLVRLLVALSKEEVWDVVLKYFSRNSDQINRQLVVLDRHTRDLRKVRDEIRSLLNEFKQVAHKAATTATQAPAAASAATTAAANYVADSSPFARDASAQRRSEEYIELNETNRWIREETDPALPKFEVRAGTPNDLPTFRFRVASDDSTPRA